MVAVMTHDFDSQKSPLVVDPPRVSIDAPQSREDLDFKDPTGFSTGVDFETQNSGIDGIRVSSGVDLEAQDTDIEIRVSSGDAHFGDDSRVLEPQTAPQLNGIRVSSGIDDVIEMELGAQNLVGGSQVAVENSEDRMRGPDTLVGSPSGSDSDIGGDDPMSQKKGVDKDEGFEGDSVNGEFRLERRRNSVSDDAVLAGSLRVLGSGFEMGDMVWGKVKSHPWWPGHIYNEAFATSSVRRSRREGHVLVAFFGDSSYGWFDPTELIPYEPHYAEKSQQINSRNFLNAVEESVDEASRRSALGISCRCRNPNNFRPANVPGYLVVDVVDFEPGAIYSVAQIQKARESFKPAETLSFIKQLAASPRSGDSKSLDLIKHKAVACAYRRSIFEEFDETYAEAFGQQPVRALKSANTPVEPRAPLSGPLVIAEALGGRKSSNKAAKVKEPSKKDRYLFKRRDEAGNLRAAQTSHAHASSVSSSALNNNDGKSDSTAANYVFQKRDHPSGGAPLRDPVAASPRGVSGKGVPTTGVDDGPGVSATSGPQQSESGAAMSTVESDLHGQDPDSGGVRTMSSSDGDPVKKKKKAKRSAGELSSEKPKILEKKMKKLKKTDGERTVLNLETHHSSGSGGLIKPAGKPVQISASSTERKDLETTDSVSQQVGPVPSGGAVEGREADLAELLADLLGLALNPFHGVERKRPAIVRQFFLKFRSLVYLKSSNASPPAESEPGETRTVRSSAAEHDRPLTDSSKNAPSLKHSKLSVRHDDPTKGGRKRVPSERQEEIAAKRAKKITEVKSLSAEKKALLKNREMQHAADGKSKATSAKMKTEQEQPRKKAEKPPRVEEPTYLVMKFQSGSSLPSVMELKARFARFGPMDVSLNRVFYKTNTCRVAFLYKQDAHVAYRYAVGSKSLFSNVKFMLRPVSEQPPSSVKAEDSHGEPVPNRDPSSTGEPKPPSASAAPPPQLKSCLKKPSGNDEPSNGSGSVKATRVRFNMGDDNKGGGTSSKRPGVQVQLQMSDSRNANLSSESGPSSSSSPSSVGVDTVSNNQRLISSRPLQPPLLPTPPPEFYRPPAINHPHQQHHVDLPSRSNLNFNVTAPPIQATLPPPPPPPPPASPAVDISQQMMSLLTRCHEVVTNVKTVLGHVPYHSL